MREPGKTGRVGVRKLGTALRAVAGPGTKQAFSIGIRIMKSPNLRDLPRFQTEWVPALFCPPAETDKFRARLAGTDDRIERYQMPLFYRRTGVP